MPAFAETYSAQQRDALFRGALDDHLGIRGVLRAAAAGELPELDAADQATLAKMTYGYACQLIRDEKHRRGMIQTVRKDTTISARDLVARLLALGDRELARLEHAKTKQPVDTGAALGAAKLIREALAIGKLLEQDASNTSAPAAEQAKPKTLAQRIAAHRGTEPDDLPATTDPGPTRRDASPANETTTTKNNTDAGPVRADATSFAAGT